MSVSLQSKNSFLSQKRQKWLADVVIALDDIEFTREQIATICHVPSSLAATLLSDNLRAHGIHRSMQLWTLGLGGLMDIEGVGEAQAWIAICLLDAAGHNVNPWIKSWHTTKGAIREAAHKKKTKAQRARAAAGRRSGRAVSSELRLAASR